MKAADNPESVAKILTLIKVGAMTAGGPLPDETTQLALARALSLEAEDAGRWHSRRESDSSGQSTVLTLTRLQQVSSTKLGGGVTDMYRLILTCRVAVREGEIKLAWANGVPTEGQEVGVGVDGGTLFLHKVEGGKKQGNGANGPGATILYPGDTKIVLPLRSLTVSNVFPHETVAFSFEDLSQADREGLSACFSVGGKN